MSTPFLEPGEWYASLPTVYVSACMLLTDDADRVLLVKPNYRAGWALPGGIVEEGETPHEGAVREVGEEVGLAAVAGDLLVVDWVPAYGVRPRPIMSFMFDGGTVAAGARIRLQVEELDDARFLPWDEAAARMPEPVDARIPAARRARKEGRTIYLPAS